MRSAFNTISSKWPVLALAVMIGLAVTGCAGSGEATTVSPSTTSAGVTTTSEMASTSTAAPASTTTTVEVGASEELLPDGNIKACGIITDVWMDGTTRKLKIDYVDFLTGAEADAAAVADGLIAPGESVDNDYYARNNNTKLRTFTVSDSVVITTYSRVEPIDVADPPCSWSDFYDFWNLVGPPEASDAGLSEGLWWIERDSDGVVAIEQQWVP